MSYKKIILSTLNARYIHSSFGLRYLFANLGELQQQAEIIEFIIKTPTHEIVENILKHDPEIVGFGIYIWNTQQSEKVIRQLKQSNPDIKIVIGGPEVSHEYTEQPLFELADHLITGQADIAFGVLCQQILNGNNPCPKLIKPAPFVLNNLEFPYKYYNNEDIAHRVIYVEASRGCPFKCEFCLSSLDKTAYPFDLDEFLNQMDRLYQRGARTFKFVDRTFNLKIPTSMKILEFFIDRIDKDLFLHFELIPDNLPEPLKALLTQFPVGTLQFEIGIQSFSQDVQTLISRRQNNTRAKENLIWLKQNTHAHLHTDLIFGLPGETLESFASSFNQLVALNPDEIQVGILKRLRGTPIVRHGESHSLVFSKTAPYEIISTHLIDSATIKQITRFSKFWDKVANSGRFKQSLDLILGDNPFENFNLLNDYLFNHFKRTHSIQLVDLFDAVIEYYSDQSIIANAIMMDKKRNFKKRPNKSARRANKRQVRHL